MIDKNLWRRRYRRTKKSMPESNITTEQIINNSSCVYIVSNSDNLMTQEIQWIQMINGIDALASVCHSRSRCNFRLSAGVTYALIPLAYYAGEPLFSSQEIRVTITMLKLLRLN